jgi:hypothetical protein
MRVGYIRFGQTPRMPDVALPEKRKVGSSTLPLTTRSTLC